MRTRSSPLEIGRTVDHSGGMPRVHFSPHITRHVGCPDQDVPGTTVREALECVFLAFPKLRDYVVDERSVVRKHVVIFSDGRAIHDREAQSDTVRPESDIYVMQALSGG